MTDPRITPGNARVAHESLRPAFPAEKYVTGETCVVRLPYTALLDAPSGRVQRQLLLGQEFQVLERVDDFVFGYALHDGYCGYLSAASLAKGQPPTHKVVVRRSYYKPTPALKDITGICGLSFGALVTLCGEQGDWAAISVIDETGQTLKRFVPSVHLAPKESLAADPVDVSFLFLHAPYLWGGNTSDGIDCSGLVQASLLACGIDCPGDSDLQEAAVGRPVKQGQPMQRGDLVFWRGHVALAVDKHRIIHANAHHMAVSVEDFATARTRISGAGGGDITSLRRL